MSHFMLKTFASLLMLCFAAQAQDLPPSLVGTSWQGSRFRADRGGNQKGHPERFVILLEQESRCRLSDRKEVRACRWEKVGPEVRISYHSQAGNWSEEFRLPLQDRG